MRKSRIFFAVLLIMAGCSTSPKDLEKQRSTQTQIRNYDSNYQEIYKRILDSAKRCSEGGIGFNASLAVDGQLYSELGFGEIAYSLINIGVRNYYWKARIEKQNDASKLTVFSGNTLNNATWLKKVTSWADGDESC
jgi:hypothetical protein